MARRCARCGAKVDPYWVDTTALGSAFNTRAEGREQCPNFCSPCCPTCGGEPGDIHGPECGPTILAKIGSLTPCTIDPQDCRLTVPV